LAAKEISKSTQSEEKLETIFICGLLHEIGKLVLYRRIPELAREISLLIESTDETDSALERRLLGFDHYQVGSELSRLWKLPEVITESIAQHNAPYNTGPFNEIAAIVRLASKLSKMELEDSIDKELERFNISQSLLIEIMNSVHDQFEEIFAIFYPKL
jgi:HD-like signal output (HDOD) protein